MNDIPGQAIADARRRLYERITSPCSAAPTVPYPAHQTVEEGKALRGEMSGTFTKNLLLKDKKDRMFLFSIHEDHALDLKILHGRIGANGRLGFASANRVKEHLGVIPGALTPLGLINDLSRAVTTFLDASIMSAEQVNFHSPGQRRDHRLRPTDLVAFRSWVVNQW